MCRKIIFIICLFTISVKAQNSIVWHENIEKTIQKAAVLHKKTLVYFSGSDWCKPCKELKNKVFYTSIFQEKAPEHFEFVNIDFTLNRNQLPKEKLKYIEQSAEKYNKKGVFPLVLILDEKGKIITSVNGYKGESVEYYLEEYLGI